MTALHWRTMDSAPKDGSQILIFPHMTTAWWEFGDDEWMLFSIPLNSDKTIADDWSVQAKMWFCVYANVGGIEPTHWMSLPDAPSSAKPEDQHAPG